MFLGNDIDIFVYFGHLDLEDLLRKCDGAVFKNRQGMAGIRSPRKAWPGTFRQFIGPIPASWILLIRMFVSLRDDRACSYFKIPRSRPKVGASRTSNKFLKHRQPFIAIERKPPHLIVLLRNPCALSEENGKCLPKWRLVDRVNRIHAGTTGAARRYSWHRLGRRPLRLQCPCPRVFLSFGQASAYSGFAPLRAGGALRRGSTGLTFALSRSTDHECSRHLV